MKINESVLTPPKKEETRIINELIDGNKIIKKKSPRKTKVANEVENQSNSIESDEFCWR